MRGKISFLFCSSSIESLICPIRDRINFRLYKTESVGSKFSLFIKRSNYLFKPATFFGYGAYVQIDE